MNAGPGVKGWAVLLIVAAAIGLSGCGGGGATAKAATTHSTTTTSTPSPTTTTVAPGPVAFVEWAKTAELGDRDPSAASDDLLLEVGNLGCNLMANAPSFGWAVQEIVRQTASMKTTPAEMDSWLRQSVVNLCPQYRDLLP